MKALLDQQGDAPRVVDMRVGHNDVVDIAGGKVQDPVVPLVPPLLQSAVDKDLLSVYLQAVAAAGDSFGRAEECELHVAPPCYLYIYSNAFPPRCKALVENLQNCHKGGAPQGPEVRKMVKHAVRQANSVQTAPQQIASLLFPGF